LIAACFIAIPVAILLRHPRVLEIYAVYQLLLGVIAYLKFVAAVAAVKILPALFVSFWPSGTREFRRRTIIRLFVVMNRRRKEALIARFLVYLWGFVVVLSRPLVVLFDATDRFIRFVLRLNEEIDASTFQNLKSVFQSRLKIEFVEISNNDRFWLPYLVLLSDSPQLVKPILKTRNLANFCRNQALGLFVAAAILSGAYNTDQLDIKGMIGKSDLIHISLLCFFSGWAFHWKFLQGHYSSTKMTYRSFATLVAAKSERKRSKSRRKKLPKSSMPTSGEQSA
jgi:hypothetical protein